MHIASCIVTYIAGFVSAILFLRLLIARQRRRRQKVEMGAGERERQKKSGLIPSSRRRLRQYSCMDL